MGARASFGQLRNFSKRAVLLVFITFLPTQLGTYFFLPFSFVNGVRTDFLAPSLFMTDIFAVVLFLMHRDLLIAKIKKTYLTYPVAILCALFLINLFVATVPLLAAYKMIKILEVYLLYVLFKSIPLQRSHVYTVFITSAVFSLTLGVAQIVSQSSLQGIFYFFGERALNMAHPDIAKSSMQGAVFLRPYATFSHPNSMGGFFALVYTFFLFGPVKKHSLLQAVGLFLCVAIVFISFSKTAILALVVVSVAWLFSRGVGKCVLCNVAYALPLVVLALISFSAVSDPLTIQKRLYLVQQFIVIVKDHFLWGVGLGNYLLHQSLLESPYQFFFTQPVHSAYLLLFSELGAVTFFYVLYICGKRMVHWTPRLPVVLFFITVFITASFDHYWVTLQQNMLLFGVILGLMRSTGSDLKTIPRHSERSSGDVKNPITSARTHRILH